MKKIVLVLGVLVAILIACAKDPAEPSTPSQPNTQPSSPVIFDLDSVPYTTLSHYNFFAGNMADMLPVQGVLPYEPITPLFSDYAHKYRFVWMPNGVKASYVSDGEVLDFPEGAVLIKTFYYDHVQPDDAHRLIETRLLIKKNGQWEFADYVWNDAQTEATLDLSGSYTAFTWMDDNGVPHDENYRIPSYVECLTCHKNSDIPVPIGPKPQNLNSTFAYTDGPMNQLAKWETEGYLQSGYPQNIETVAKWDDPNEDMTRRVRAYVDMNCSHCHAENHHCGYRPMRFAWNQTTNLTNIGVCVPTTDPIEPSQDYVVHAGNSGRSMLYYRISSTDPSVRMPLMGRTVRHEEAIQLIGDWINSLPDTCQ